MRGPVRLGKDAHGFVAVASPEGQDGVGKSHQVVYVFASQADDGHGPVNDAARYVVPVAEVAGKVDLPADGSLGHSKGVAAALEVLMGQDGAAHDGQIRVGPYGIVGKDGHELEKPCEGVPLDLHGPVLAR